VMHCYCKGSAKQCNDNAKLGKGQGAGYNGVPLRWHNIFPIINLNSPPVK
jgi:hypothetical protein